MCNLYAVRTSAAVIAAHFGAETVPDLIVPTEVRPGEPGLIVRGAVGQRSLHVVTWGFPRPQADNSGQTVEPKLVNLVADLTNPMWDQMVPDPRYRCLIPVTAFAQPDGPKGWMTRTWFSIPEWPLFAWAGFCRAMPEWGPVYGAMTGDSNEAVAPLNPRTPIILAPSEYERWLTGSIEDVIGFQFRPPFPAARMAIERTDELWVPRGQRRIRTRQEVLRRV